MKNCIKLQGTVVHIFKTNSTTIITLFVGNKNYPEIYCFGKLKKYVDENIKENINIFVNAYIKNTRQTAENIIYYTQNIIGLNVIEIKSDFQKIFNIKETYFNDYKNEVFLYGTIEKVKSIQNNFIHFVIKLNNKQKQKILIAAPFYFKDIIIPNNYICLYAHIQTKTKDINNNIKRYETIVAKDIKVIRKDENL